jgi:hypothetical protein
MGMMAVKAAIAAIDSEKFSLPEFPLELVIRQSVSIVDKKNNNGKRHR